MNKADRSAWLGKVGTETEAYRAGRAKTLRTRGHQRSAVLRHRGFSDAYIAEKARWHESRARGQEQRIERVEACGAEVLRITCPECGQVHERVATCRIALLCLRCRGLIAGQKRAAFGRARTRILQEASARGLLNPHRRGGRFGEKFLTLTAPHRAGDSIEGRIDGVLDAWAGFLRRLRRWLRERGARTLHFFRVVEWTPASDGLGHPHLHVWLFSPFLERAELVAWWRRSLQDVGCTIADEQQLVVDVRESKRAIGDYLVKYLLKDSEPDGSLVDPAVYGRVYAALDQRRRTQCSQGFARLAEKDKARCDCGSALPREVRRRPQATPRVQETRGES